MEKKLILVVSPPASGKTYISKKLAETLTHVVYLDKDSVIPLSDVIFDVAGEPHDRESAFFERYIRNQEYEVTLNFAYDALNYDDIVLINAPFSREIRDNATIDAWRKKLADDYHAKLYIIWVATSLDVIHERMIARNSPRDVYKLKDWDAYVKSQNFSIPENLLEDNEKETLLVFYNDNEEQFQASMSRIISELQEEDVDE